jgi:hypothetical protein
MKIDGVPVELKVATIFWAIIALLPMPLNTIRPLQLSKSAIALSKSSSTNF